MTRHLDLRADLHGHATEYASDDDRAWFTAHPSAAQRVRPPHEHEWCCPLCVDEGAGCKPITDVEFVVVTRFAWGRARQPHGYGHGDGCRKHRSTLPELPIEALLDDHTHRGPT